MYDVREWRHVFKLDPNKEITDEELDRICESGTDAIMVGGTDGITLEGVLDLMSRVRRYTVPCILEVSTIDSITPGFDFYYIPTVLNSGNTQWITGLHHEAVKEYGDLMDWDEMMVEGYCILNPECKAARLTEAKTDLGVEDVRAFAMMAEKMFHLPIFYMEYSGTYGDPELVKAAKSVLEKTILFYGGGIETAEQAAEMAAHSDVIVVGNVLYSNLDEALKTVVAAKKIGGQV
jgi:putative glycerol-1-phosphate prenyltransferase